MSELQKIYRSEYTKPDFAVSGIHLEFRINKEFTLVSNRACYYRQREGAPLVLNGEGQEVLFIEMDGKELTAEQWSLVDGNLVVPNVPEHFTLTTTVKIFPAQNKSGMGLYQSDSIFCTQCESEGFRKITYFLDRPDVMTAYTVKIVADKKEFPFLLSNGNQISSEELPDGMHAAVWNDPFPKPSYLFALVAGDLAVIEDSYKTTSGKDVALKIFVDHGNESRATYAMQALKDSMKWDEDTFGLECDLDTYMIVAVDSFNMGAMENKGLNIFNSMYVLADGESATDRDFLNVQAVVGHEYFHNWTGNRITCRDWFQLTLKEGLTVFRDQEFSADMNSRAVKRIETVAGLRAGQFIEDASPISHPIRPDSYSKIDNFYTSTIYQKGGEVIRMIETLLGVETFRQGITKYFELFDGQAVTCDDFVFAMEEVSGRDLSQFKLWYSQAGTPVIDVEDNYNAETKQYSLTFTQSSPTQPANKPYHIPVSMGLISEDGTNFAEQVVELTEEVTTIKFDDVTCEPTPSLLRGFSAPVKLNYNYSKEKLIFLLENDNDEFNRYEAAQRLAIIAIGEVIAQANTVGSKFKIDRPILDAYKSVLNSETLDPAIKAQILTLPSLSIIGEHMNDLDYSMAFKAREFMMKSMSVYLEFDFVATYDRLSFIKGPDKIGERSLKNCCLSYLSELGDMYKNVIYKQFCDADNMTDSLAAMKLLCDMARCCQSKSDHTKSDERELALQAFYDRWKDNSTVMNKWFSIQSGTIGNGVIEKIAELEKSEAFDAKNPNKLSALYRVFTANLLHFHSISGAGYKLVADKIIEIDKFNDSISSTIARGFNKLHKLDPIRHALMKQELERIMENNPSDSLKEIVVTTLNNA